MENSPFLNSFPPYEPFVFYDDNLDRIKEKNEETIKSRNTRLYLPRHQIEACCANVRLYSGSHN